MANLSFGGAGGSSYFDRARQQQIFVAYSTITSMVAYSTAAGTGGPLLWNGTGTSTGTNRVMAVLLGVGFGISTAAGAAGALGITGNNLQPSAPTSTTAITAVANTYIGGAAPQCTAYNVGTVAHAGSFLMPIASLGTGALTVDNLDYQWVDLAGSLIVPSGSWAAVSASATMTTSVLQIGLMWAEVPY